jgi:hypothetical protein
MSLSVSYTKKGSGRCHPIYRKEGSKLIKKQIKHTVSLKNAVNSIVQAHFDQKARERFFS